MLKGKNVILRAIEREDLRRLHELERHVDLAILGGGAWRPVPYAAIEKNFEKHLDDDDRSNFVIEIDGKVVGDIELHSRDRRSRVSALGIAISDPEYVGRGYGREALRLFLDWAFRIQNYERIWLDTWATNERAIRCYQAVGFVEEGRLRRHIYVDGAYVDAIVMGLLRAEWEVRRER
jgi:RimJ/RimL family protein N-acetyltransferase